jgi:hypothetical protein
LAVGVMRKERVSVRTTPCRYRATAARFPPEKVLAKPTPRGNNRSNFRDPKPEPGQHVIEK